MYRVHTGLKGKIVHHVLEGSPMTLLENLCEISVFQKDLEKLAWSGASCLNYLLLCSKFHFFI